MSSVLEEKQQAKELLKKLLPLYEKSETKLTKEIEQQMRAAVAAICGGIRPTPILQLPEEDKGLVKRARELIREQAKFPS